MIRLIIVNQRDGRSLVLGRRAVLVGLGAVLAALVAGAFGAWQLTLPDTDRRTLAALEAELLEQRADLDHAQAAAYAQRAALARRLGGMQARMMRIEALGERVIEAAGVSSDEFDFESEPALGGPEEGGEAVVPPIEPLLVKIERDMRRREAQLQALGDVLENRSFVRLSQPAGRPITEGWLSSRYGRRIDPITGESAWHSGVDFAGKRGSDVIAVAAGVVVEASSQKGFGRYVEVDHGNGWTTRYAHLDSFDVAAGDIVTRGQRLGAMGSSGRSTGPHVHFEVRQNGRKVNPQKVLQAAR